MNQLSHTLSKWRYGSNPEAFVEGVAFGPRDARMQAVDKV